jgi:hypothetical protein
MTKAESRQRQLRADALTRMAEWFKAHVQDIKNDKPCYRHHGDQALGALLAALGSDINLAAKRGTKGQR